MALKYGIIGLPNVGKTTLFNTLTRLGAEAANYPFCTIEPNIGMVPVPDPRLDRIGKIAGTEKVTPTFIEFVDIAGLVKGASRGEGLGNKFLAHIREVDAVIHVIRGFQDPNVAHVAGKMDPLEDLGVVKYELIMADLDTIQKRKERTAKLQKSEPVKYKSEMSQLEKLENHLNQGGMARELSESEDLLQISDELFLLTCKPVLYVINVDDNTDENRIREIAEEIKKTLGEEKSEVLVICAQLEFELLDFSVEEKKEYLKSCGWKETGLERLITSSYRLLDIITFFTAKGKETRAWTVPRNTRAVKAAGKIHSDMEKGFIRAEVISFEKLEEAGSLVKAREKGWIRLEGRDYIIQDGDVVQFRFNV